ncbi:PIN domain-containing protein [Streptomyces sp. WAC06128]|uniref:PIN domain-containing protein n=1 Tax=Streptomyces sp. WAC06128 TaxID=2487426 RepID=UPI000FA7A558|nr:PIN domain-containing protein [Streptomyces sp. WAC06128]RSS67628.1 hypothetical protein EF911_34350 [Streptomyces sp. WAC06128]
MIILDTCVMRGMRLDGSDVEVLRATVATGTERVSAPSMAVEELAAQKAIDYLEAHRAAARALRQLGHKSSRTEPKLEEPDAEGVRQMWRRKYDFLQVLPTSGDAALEGLYREANVLPPAGTKGDGDKQVKVGARDVAIWLTAVEYAREHPDETVYFVSENHKDFTKGDTGYPAPMDSDVEGLGDRFVHLTNLGELLETVAPKQYAEEGYVHALLRFHTDYVARRARKTWRSRPNAFEVRTREGDAMAARWWAFPDDVRVQLLDVRDSAAYKLGTHSWIVTTARWEFVGLAMTTSSLQQGACVWETRILFPVAEGDEPTPRIMASRPAVPVEDASAVDWPPLLDTWEYMQRVQEVAAAEGRKATWVELLTGMLLAFPLLQQGADADLSQYPAVLPSLVPRELSSFQLEQADGQSADDESDED